MKKARIVFRRCIQDSQDYGSDDEHMISRVFFDLEIGDDKHSNLYADIKQPVGDGFETAPLEVSSPHDYRGPLNYSAYRDAVEGYYRGLVGAQGTDIHIEGASNIYMRNNLFVKQQVAEFEVDEGTDGW